jgi:hypothetical protein
MNDVVFFSVFSIIQAAELSADFRDSRARFREKKFTSADKKFQEFFFLGVNPSNPLSASKGQ